MHAQHQDARLGMLRANLPRRLDPADPRQRAVHHRNFWFQLDRQLHCVIPVARFADHHDRGIVFQHPPESLAHQRVIVHQQNGDFIRHEPPPSLAAPASAPASLPFPMGPAPTRLRSIPPARAFPPIQSPDGLLAARSLCHDLLRPVPIRCAGIAAAPRPLSLPNGGSHYSRLPATRDKCAPPPPCLPQTPYRPFHSATTGPSGATPRGCTNRACSPNPVLPAIPGAAPAITYGYCSASIARFPALPASPAATVSPPALDFPAVPAMTRSPSAPARTRHAIPARYAAAWTLAWKLVFAPARCAVRRA